MIGWVVAAIGTTAAACVLAELAARAWLRWRDEYYVWRPGSRLLMELDRDALPELEPSVRFEVNAEGERGDPLPRDWRSSMRVLVAGGSVAECWLLDQQSSWPAVIQQILNEPASLRELGVERVYVGNIARSLVDCRRLNLMFERVLPRYERLDVVVLLVGASDVVHWLEKGTPPKISDEPIAASEMFDEQPEGPFGWTAKTLALRRVLSRWNKRLRAPVEVRQRAGARLAEARAMRARAAHVLDAVPDPAPMLERFERDLRELVLRSRAKAKRVIVVRQPWFEKELSPEEERHMWNFGQGRPYREEVLTYYSHRVVWELMRQVDQRTARIAAELGAEEVELMSVLERSLEIYYDELHHTPRGCREVGRAVAEVILRRERDGARSSFPARLMPTRE